MLFQNMTEVTEVLLQGFVSDTDVVVTIPSQFLRLFQNRTLAFRLHGDKPDTTSFSPPFQHQAFAVDTDRVVGLEHGSLFNPKSKFAKQFELNRDSFILFLDSLQQFLRINTAR
nr:hypothetical protein [Pseudogulbenkiania sp. MAI-1]